MTSITISIIISININNFIRYSWLITNTSSCYYFSSFSFNCVISVFGMIILSLISITGFIYFYKNLGSSFKWLLYPLALSIILFIAIFQQTWSAHLQGYSYPFALIFSMGLFSAYNFLIQKIQISKFISTIGLLPALIAIITSNIRVIYITGVMGWYVFLL